MTWVITHHGVVVARGTYQQMLDTAEEWQVLEREWHRDGTQLSPIWTRRGYALCPAAGAAQVRGRAA